LKVLAVADSDSYLKWAAGLLDELPPEWTTELAVVRTPIAPSPDQIRAAVSGTRAGTADPPAVLPVRALRRTAERFAPDVVLVACTGPVVDVLVAEVFDELRPRAATAGTRKGAGRGAVFVTGLPGISIPATEKAWVFRSGCDMFIVHSGREVEEFARIGKDLGVQGVVALARLPYLDHGVTTLSEVPAARNRVIFATQAKVPKRREEREQILLTLAELAERRTDLDVVVKLRARDTERQTHNERHHYERLWNEMAAAGTVRPDTLTFAAGPMHEQLVRAIGFVTVSSTAALEAIEHAVPLLILSDFGVSAEMINLVFEDSGCLGTLDDLAAGRFLTPDEAWCRANYFHDPSAIDLVSRMTSLVEQARAGLLPAPRPLLDGAAHAAGRRRARLRLEVPPKVLRAGYRAKRRVRRYLRALG
jgi:hypothetical protein